MAVMSTKDRVSKQNNTQKTIAIFIGISIINNITGEFAMATTKEYENFASTLGWITGHCPVSSTLIVNIS